MSALFLQEKDYVQLARIHPVLGAVVIATARRWGDQEQTVFRVTSGRRTEEEQAKLFAAGASNTLRSKHLDGVAVDLAVLNRHRTRAHYEWPFYERLNATMQASAKDLGVVVEWGGHWIKLRDGVHWQLANFPWE